MPRPASGQVYLVGARAQAEPSWGSLRLSLVGARAQAEPESACSLATGCRLQATRYRLQATGYRLRAAGYGWVYQAVSKACDPRGKSTAMLRLYLVGVRVS